MFCPSRRSILYFASWRLLIRVLVLFGHELVPKTDNHFRDHAALVEDRALLCPGFLPEPTGLPPKRRCKPRVAKHCAGPLRPAQWAEFRGNPAQCQTTGAQAAPVEAAWPIRMPKRASAAAGVRP